MDAEPTPTLQRIHHWNVLPVPVPYLAVLLGQLHDAWPWGRQGSDVSAKAIRRRRQPNASEIEHRFNRKLDGHATAPLPCGHGP